MKSSSQDRRPARERLLAAADELFYGEGFNLVGIDRVIERAGVAKASLYDYFGSKEELIRSYLQQRHEEEAFDQERFLRGGRLSLALTSKRSGSVQAVSAGRLVSNRTIVPCRSPLSSRKRM